MHTKYLIQTENINCGTSQPIYSNKSLNQLLYIYGSQIEGETVTIHDFQQDITHKWIYENGKYSEC